MGVVRNMLYRCQKKYPAAMLDCYKGEFVGLSMEKHMRNGRRKPLSS